MVIEMLGTGGTSLGKFTRRCDVAWTEWQDDERRVLVVYSSATHQPLAEVDTQYSQVSDYDTGEYIGHACTWDDVMKLALGKPGYGYSWYAVKGHKRGYCPPFWAR